jgi:hypothetical protein
MHNHVAITLQHLERTRDGGWSVVFHVRGFTEFSVPVTLGPGFDDDVDAVNAAKGALQDMLRDAGEALAGWTMADADIRSRTVTAV